MMSHSRPDTIDGALAQVAQAHAERTALIDAGGRCTYRELWQQVCRFARLLHEDGIRPGDRVVLLMPTSIMHTVAVLGCMRARAVPTSLHIRESVRTLAVISERLAPRSACARRPRAWPPPCRRSRCRSARSRRRLRPMPQPRAQPGHGWCRAIWRQPTAWRCPICLPPVQRTRPRS